MASSTGKPSCENSEWWEVLQIGNGTIHCQLDTDAYASVINTMQLKQVAPNANIKPNKKTLMSYSQHRITPLGYVTLLVRFKGRRLNVNFYVIDSKQKPMLSSEYIISVQTQTSKNYWTTIRICKVHPGNLFHKD